MRSYRDGWIQAEAITLAFNEQFKINAIGDEQLEIANCDYLTL